jgi:hypothetical protein
MMPLLSQLTSIPWPVTRLCYTVQILNGPDVPDPITPDCLFPVGFCIVVHDRLFCGGFIVHGVPFMGWGLAVSPLNICAYYYYYNPPLSLFS